MNYSRETVIVRLMLADIEDAGPNAAIIARMYRMRLQDRSLSDAFGCDEPSGRTYGASAR